MVYWKSRCINFKYPSLLVLTLHVMLISFIGMSIMTVSLMLSFDETNPDSTYSKLDYVTIGIITIALWFNNINTLLILLVHYLKVFPYVIFNHWIVLMESMIFALITYISIKIEIPINTITKTLVPLAPEIIICAGLFLYRNLMRTKFNTNKSKYENNLKQMPYNNKFSKYLDILSCFLIPGVPLVIIAALIFIHC